MTDECDEFDAREPKKYFNTRDEARENCEKKKLAPDCSKVKEGTKSKKGKFYVPTPRADGGEDECDDAVDECNEDMEPDARIVFPTEAEAQARCNENQRKGGKCTYPKKVPGGWIISTSKKPPHQRKYYKTESEAEANKKPGQSVRYSEKSGLYYLSSR